jgi:Na+:H+ antiporter, NhaA family
MRRQNEQLTRSFKEFAECEKVSGLIIIFVTAFSVLLANSSYGPGYLASLHIKVARISVEHWINDGLMAVFFLYIGLELERELYKGELSNLRLALLPILAALGGLSVPALIHFFFNSGTATQAGVGIPMATDIAFALGVLGLIGSRVPASLKVFLTALAVMDDLGAIIIIAVFYTSRISLLYLAGAILVFGLLIILNRLYRVMSLIPYALAGILMWFLMLNSGVHATVAGVLLAFTIPFSPKRDDEESPSHRLEQILNRPVALLILPLFALANTGIVVSTNWANSLSSRNSIGIFAGLVVGKPLGICLLVFAGVAIGLCQLPLGLKWRHVVGVGFLGGIGFTMSIFITNLAFAENVEIVNSSKMAILLSSLVAGTIGGVWLLLVGKPQEYIDTAINDT